MRLGLAEADRLGSNDHMKNELSNTHLAVVKHDGSLILMSVNSAARAHGIAGHFGYTIRRATKSEVSNALKAAGVK